MNQKRDTLGPGPLSDAHLPTLNFAARRSIKREILTDLQTSWQQGAPVPPEDLLARWPTDPRQDTDVAQLLFEDFHERFRHGDNLSISDYEARFPEHQKSLADLVHTHDFLASIGARSGSSCQALRLPTVEEEVFGFRLKAELGHGAFARVFLAEQMELAGRPVVLKVSAIVGNEPQTLAQLQHTNIVPIYSLHDDERAGLRAVCMPYFGGATLAQVRNAIWDQGATPTSGQSIVRFLETLPNQNARATTATDAVVPLTALRGYSHVQAVAWIGARLAEALQHAHERGVYHRDIKPSNILLTDDGQPMLLDFNLAHDLHDTAAEATLGGTVAYMAPEHLRALVAPDSGPSRFVDQRSDIYSLGLVLYELLLGHSAFDQNASYTPMRQLVEVMAVERAKGLPGAKRFGPAVPLSLESIVRKCLAPDAEQRYQHAEQLAEDLRRFLDDRSLQYAPELSWTEPIGKWMRRHPRLTSSSSVAGVALLVIALIGASMFGIHEMLQSARARERAQKFETGALHALCLMNTMSEFENHIQLGVPVCEETLALYDVLDRDDWQHDQAWQRLDGDERHRLAEDIRELLGLLAWGRVRTSPGNKTVVRDALSLLDRAEAIRALSPSQALRRDRARYHEILGEADLAQQARAAADAMKPASARDHYLLATAYARQQTRAGYAQAIAELNAALTLNPRHYWSLMQRGICGQELGELTLAAADFGQCIGLRQDVAWGYFNRGCVLDQSGKKAEAILDYSAAIAKDAKFLLAHVKRGLANLDRKEYVAALADFERARDLGRDDAYLYAGMGMALEGLGKAADADKAFRAAFTRSSSARAESRARLLLSYGFAVSARLPENAWQAFAEILTQDAKHPRALYGQAMLLVEQAQPGGRAPNGAEATRKLDQAIELFNQAIDAHPHFTDARRFRAVLCARRGQFKQAYQDMDFCLAAEPQAGVTLYAAACVAALSAQTAEAKSAERAIAQSLAFLEQAFRHDYGPQKAARDPDLRALHGRPDFQRLLASNP